MANYLGRDDLMAIHVILSQEAENKMRERKYVWTKDWTLDESSLDMYTNILW